ncbi:MAG: phage holin family protein [Candidatus Paceibacterota bacterium]
MIIHFLLSALALAIASWIVPGVVLPGIWTTLLATFVLALINIFIKPILFVLTLPINILTLGLFSLVINALLILLATKIVPGFEVSGFLTAVLFSIVLSIINIVFGK